MNLLITGGSGSLGSAIAKEALGFYDIIKIFSRSEYPQWKMQQDKVFQDKRFRFVIGDIRDKDRLTQCLRDVDHVIHCAALKHVALCQQNPKEMARTNIIGSSNVVDACLEAGVKKAIAVSSDKAVTATTFYGASKFVMEGLFLNGNIYNGTKFSVLRSGNFTESRGNVLELWKRQAQSGEITLTDENMWRYFIPIKDVAKLLIKLLNDMDGQEIFVPKMIEYPMKDLLNGLYPDVKIKITGKGTGEKLAECLFFEDEKPEDMGDYWRVKP